MLYNQLRKVKMYVSSNLNINNVCLLKYKSSN